MVPKSTISVPMGPLSTDDLACVKSDPQGSLKFFLAEAEMRGDHPLFMRRMSLLKADAVPGLLHYLRTTHGPAQFSAMCAIRRYGDVAACDAIVELLARSDHPLEEKTRVIAYQSLAKHGGRKYAAVLRNQFQVETNLDSRVVVGAFLADLGDDSARHLFLDLLRSDDRASRALAARKLAALYGTDLGTNAAAWSRFLTEHPSTGRP